MSILQIAETIKENVDDVTIEFVPARPGDFSGKEVSSTRAKEELGWEAITSFKDGVSRYIEWFRERQSLRESEKADIERIVAGL